MLVWICESVAAHLELSASLQGTTTAPPVNLLRRLRRSVSYCDNIVLNGVK